MHFTNEQQQIIKHIGSHAKVMAVAGSGKTTTMIERIIRLIKDGQDPKRILVLMFNASASSEFSSRLQKRSKEEGIIDTPEVRTFHAMAMKMCKYLSKINVIPDYNLEAREWVSQNLANMALEPFLNSKNNKGKNKKEAQQNFYQFIDLVKSDIKSPSEKIKEMPKIIGSELPIEYIQAYDNFEEKRKNMKIRFFSDLIKDPVTAFLSNPKTINKISNIYDHIILDEYQDINEVQQRITKFVAGDRAEVMAVGDADQCIYEWRGAKPEYIVKMFEYDFPDAKKYTLSRTYRYGDELSLFVNNIITLNKNRDNKICVSNDTNKDTDVNVVIETKKDIIPSFIEKQKIKTGKYADSAILLRKFSMSVSPELDLIKKSIPYVIVGGESVFKRSEITSLECFLHIVNDTFNMVKSNDIKIEMLSNFFKIPYCGMKTEMCDIIANKIISVTPDEKIYESVLNELKKVKSYTKNDKGLGKKISSKINSINFFRSNSKRLNARKTLEGYIEDVGLYEYFDWSSSTPSIADEKEFLVNEFIKYAKNFDKRDVKDFIQNWIDMSTQSDENNSMSSDKVLITSIHRSKGLEWNTVIIPSLKDDKFPGLSNEKNIMIEEAERRLFYVGSTRAINTLVLMHPEDRMFKDWVRTPDRSYPFMMNMEASRFLYQGAIDEVKKVISLYKKNKKYVEVVDKKLYQKYFKEKNINLKIKDKNDISIDLSEISKITG